MKRIENFLITKKIGEGTYSEVYEAKKILPNILKEQKIALKIYRKFCHDTNNYDTITPEIQMLKSLKHQNIIKLMKVVESNRNEKILVLEYVEGNLGDLLKYNRENKRSMSKKTIKFVMKQLLLALEYMHGKLILHRDLKPPNILIDRKYRIKITDFGLSCSLENEKDFDSDVSTMWYKSPELLIESPKYDGSVDIWAIGCIFSEMITGKILFPGRDENNQLDKILEIIGRPINGCIHGEIHEDHNKLYEYIDLNHIGFNAYDLLKKMLVINPKKRITAKEALNHNYFK